MLFFFCLFFLVFILLAVMFITLLERNVISSSQFRIGPKRFLQPLMDGLNLFKNSEVLLSELNNFVIFLTGAVLLGISYLLWFLLSNVFQVWSIFLLMMAFLQLVMFCFLLVPLVSSSKYSILAAIRSIAQKISYEVLISVIVFCVGLGLKNLVWSSFYFAWLIVVLIIVWLVTCLSELNRTPFDFEEAESEFVSGYNTDLSGVVFSLFFLSEYSSILFTSFLGGYIFGIWGVCCFFFFFLFVRCVYPRWRYDFMMIFCWCNLLPVVLLFSFFIVIIMFIG